MSKIITPPAKKSQIEIDKKEYEIREVSAYFILEQESIKTTNLNLIREFSNIPEDEIQKLGNSQVDFISDEIIKLSGLSKEESKEGKQ